MIKSQGPDPDTGKERPDASWVKRMEARVREQVGAERYDRATKCIDPRAAIQREPVEQRGRIFSDTTKQLCSDAKRRFPKDGPVVLTSSKEDMKLANEVLGAGDVKIRNIHTFGLSWLVIFVAGFLHLCVHFGMCGKYYLRGCLTSGLASTRTELILTTFDYFAWLLVAIKASGDIINLWVTCSDSGVVDPHQDKFRKSYKCARYRKLTNFGNWKKVMWFRDKETGAMFGIAVPHATMVRLSQYGSGHIGPIEHWVTNGHYGWVIATQQ